MFVALTFDDGTIHQYNVAKTLSKLGIKCTIFCITQLKKHPRTGKQLLVTKPKKLRELRHIGHEIGSHSCTHPNLRRVTLERLEIELKQSKQKLETILNDKIYGFAYPHSLINATVVEATKKYYLYARNGGIDNVPHMTMTDSYVHVLKNIGIKALAKQPLIINQPKHTKFLTVMMHDVPTIMVLILVCYFKLFFRAQFVTMNELANKIKPL